MTHDTELLAALEAATGPSRELDAEIALAAGWENHVPYGSSPHGWWQEPGSEQWVMTPSTFTSSLDAALTLVPEGWDAIIYTSSPRNRERPQVELYRLVRKPQGIQIRVQAATLSLALCIAAIRARGEGG